MVTDLIFRQLFEKEEFYAFPKQTFLISEKSKRKPEISRKKQTKIFYQLFQKTVNYFFFWLRGEKN
jgi:hypothetical protein